MKTMSMRQLFAALLVTVSTASATLVLTPSNAVSVTRTTAKLACGIAGATTQSLAWVYWGTNSASTNAGAWAATNAFPSVTSSNLSVTVSNLTPGATYSFAWSAAETNGATSVWAAVSTFSALASATTTVAAMMWDVASTTPVNPDATTLLGALAVAHPIWPGLATDDVARAAINPMATTQIVVGIMATGTCARATTATYVGISGITNSLNDVWTISGDGVDGSTNWSYMNAMNPFRVYSWDGTSSVFPPDPTSYRSGISLFIDFDTRSFYDRYPGVCQIQMADGLTFPNGFTVTPNSPVVIGGESRTNWPTAGISAPTVTGIVDIVLGQLTNGLPSGTNLTGSIFNNGLLTSLGTAITPAGTGQVQAAMSGLYDANGAAAAATNAIDAAFLSSKQGATNGHTHAGMLTNAAAFDSAGMAVAYANPVRILRTYTNTTPVTVTNAYTGTNWYDNRFTSTGEVTQVATGWPNGTAMLYVENTATGLPSIVNYSGVSTYSSGGYSTNAPTLAAWWSATLLHTESSYQQIVTTNSTAPGTP